MGWLLVIMGLSVTFLALWRVHLPYWQMRNLVPVWIAFAGSAWATLGIICWLMAAWGCTLHLRLDA